MLFSDKHDNFRQFVFSFDAQRTFNRESMEFQLLFLFSFFLGSVFHEDKDSSLNKFEGFFSQRLLVAVTRKYLKRRILHSYGHAGSFNSSVITNKEAE